LPLNAIIHDRWSELQQAVRLVQFWLDHFSANEKFTKKTWYIIINTLQLMVYQQPVLAAKN